MKAPNRSAFGIPPRLLGKHRQHLRSLISSEVNRHQLEEAGFANLRVATHPLPTRIIMLAEKDGAG